MTGAAADLTAIHLAREREITAGVGRSINKLVIDHQSKDLAVTAGAALWCGGKRRVAHWDYGEVRLMTNCSSLSWRRMGAMADQDEEWRQWWRKVPWRIAGDGASLRCRSAAPTAGAGGSVTANGAEAGAGGDMAGITLQTGVTGESTVNCRERSRYIRHG